MKLEINNPCSENFDNFKKTANGGFCNSCQKEVIDFTKMSSKEILEYFKNNKKETCGSFTSIQLEQSYQNYEKPKYNFFRNIGFAVLSIFSFNTVQSQKSEPTEISPKKFDKTDNRNLTISGIVSDEIATIRGVNVIKKGTSEGVNTDMNGNYEIKAKKGDILIFSFMGYDDVEITVLDITKVHVTLKESTNLLQAVKVNGYHTQMKGVITGSVLSKKPLKSFTKKGFWKK